MSSINIPPYLPHLEWEFLNEGHRIENPTLPPDLSLPGTATILELQRADQYSLKATIRGPLNKRYTPDDGTPGGLVPSFEIKGTDSEGIYELTGCLLGGIHCRISRSDISTMDHRFEAKLHVQKIRRVQAKPENSPSWLTEWYLNGVHSPHLFNRSTKRTLKSEYLREREVYGEPEQRFDGGANRSFSSDYAYVQCPDFEFIVHEVPEGLGPTWSKSIGIEYREYFGRIPDAPEREAVSEIVGFVMGKDLINVGYTIFDESGAPLERCAVQPWRENRISLCQAPALPPIDIPILTNQFETVLQNLVPKYLEVRKDLKLNEALMSYWIGEALPIGINIPIMANGIEILTNAWFKSERSKSKGVYMPSGEFSALIEEEITCIASKLEGSPYKERILRKMQNAINMGSGERIENFFQELGLKMGTLEREAMKARNKMIHSRVPMSGQEELEKVVRLSSAYRTLFHRVVLKVLGYTGRYIDYATVGLPEREIEEAIG